MKIVNSKYVYQLYDNAMTIDTVMQCNMFCTELKPIESPLLQIDSSMTDSIILGTEPSQRMDSYHRTNQLVTARHFLTPQSMEFLKGHRYFLKATITTFSLFTFKSHHSGLFPLSPSIDVKLDDL